MTTPQREPMPAEPVVSMSWEGDHDGSVSVPGHVGLCARHRAGLLCVGESADDVDAITMSRAEVVGIISGELEAGEIDGRADAGADSATLWLCQRVLLCAQRSAVVV